MTKETNKTKCRSCNGEGFIMEYDDSPGYLVKNDCMRCKNTGIELTKTNKTIEEYDKQFSITEFVTDRAYRLNRDFFIKAQKQTEQATEARIRTIIKKKMKIRFDHTMVYLDLKDILQKIQKDEEN